MSYQEKRAVVNIVSSILFGVAYVLYALNRYQSGMAEPDDLKFWAVTMLKFIGVAVVAIIILQIVFHILMSIGIAVKETVKGGKSEKDIDRTIKSTFVEDEMDKLIGLKSSRIGFYIAGTGFAASLVSIMMNASSVVMLHIIFLSFFVAAVIEGIMNLYYYRRGVRNG